MLGRLQGDGPPHPRLPLVLTNFAGCLTDMGQYDRAGELLNQALAAKRQDKSPESKPVAAPHRQTGS